MPHKIQAAIREDREARAAAHIAMIVDLTVDATLFQLRKLEEEGQIRHWVDERSVVRWQLVEPEEVKPGLVALDVMVRLANGTYDLTPAARRALGIDG
jgi:predicted ArsR family transcriptional regulator